MKIQWLACSILLWVSLVITSGKRHSFPRKRFVRHRTEPSRSLALIPNQPRKMGTDLSSLSSSNFGFSPDTNAQRKSQHYEKNYRQHNPHLHSSIPMDHDCNSDGPMTRAVCNARNLLLKNRCGNTVLQPYHSRESNGLTKTVTTMAVSNARNLLLKTRGGNVVLQPYRSKESNGLTKTATSIASTTNKISKVDFAIFVAYFCNIAVLTLSVVAIPAIAAEHNLSPHATTAFCASMASIAPLGGFVGKIINGFVCQRLGGQRCSGLYLLAMAALCFGLSTSKGLAQIGFFMVGFEFLTSIQWTSCCSILDQHYRQNPRLKARGITILSISSTVGALTAKTVGAILLQATKWRTVYQCGTVMALLGSTAMFVLGGAPAPRKGLIGAVTKMIPAGGQQENHSPLEALKIVLGNPIFWMIGMGHSLGHITRVSDKLLGPFLQEVGGISSSMAVGLTSSVTLGFVIGLFRGSVFRKLQSKTEKTKMLRNSYFTSVLSMLGLAACGIQGVSRLVCGNAKILMAAITIFSGLIANSLSFQFYQIPNLMSSSIFPETFSVSLSLIDAVGFLVTACVLGLNRLVLTTFGWSTSWAFMALFFSFGGMSMMQAMRPVLIKSERIK